MSLRFSWRQHIRTVFSNWNTCQYVNERLVQNQKRFKSYDCTLHLLKDVGLMSQEARRQTGEKQYLPGSGAVRFIVRICIAMLEYNNDNAVYNSRTYPAQGYRKPLYISGRTLLVHPGTSGWRCVALLVPLWCCHNCVCRWRCRAAHRHCSHGTASTTTLQLQRYGKKVKTKFTINSMNAFRVEFVESESALAYHSSRSLCIRPVKVWLTTPHRPTHPQIRIYASVNRGQWIGNRVSIGSDNHI